MLEFRHAPSRDQAEFVLTGRFHSLALLVAGDSISETPVANFKLLVDSPSLLGMPPTRRNGPRTAVVGNPEVMPEGS